MPLDIKAIKARLAAATPGPWRWSYLYQCHGTHWCLENEKSAGLGMTINYHLVTLGTEEYDYDDDNNATRLDQTPDFQLIAHAPTDIADLIAEVERLRAELAGPQVGDRAICSQCGEPLVCSGAQWYHTGIQQPKHPALPRDDTQDTPEGG